MNKQLLSILSIVISVGLAIGIYLFFAQIEDKNLKPIQVIPDNSAIIIESNNSSAHLGNMADPTFMERMFANEKIANFYHQILFYDSLLKESEITEEWFTKGQATYSFHVFDNKTIGFFMAVQTQKDIDAKIAAEFFQEHFPNRYKLSKRKFLNFDLFDFTDFKEGTHFTIAFRSKLMLFSPDGALVEMALSKISMMSNEPNYEDKLAFVKNSGNGLNIYFNFKNLPNFIKSALNENYQHAFDILGNFAERSIYNIDLDDDEIVLKGAAQTHETNFQYLDLLNSQAPIQNNLRALMPQGIHFSYTFGFNGYASFFKNVNEYLLSKKLFTPYKVYLDSIEGQIQYPFFEKFSSQIGSHAAIMAIDEPGFWKDSCYVMAIESADEFGMANLLKEMERAVQRKNESDTSFIKKDSLLSNDIYKCYLGDGLKFYFTDLFEGLEANYYINYHGYFFFANNPKILKELQKRWSEQKLIRKEENFKKFEDKLSPNSNLEILIMNDHAPKFALNFLNKDWFSLINQNMGYFKRAQRMAIQFAGSNDKIFATQLYVHFNITKAEKTEKIWSIALDTTLISKPQVMFNYSLGTHVILVQDAKKQLYMIDREGKVLWKQQLFDPIISPISELDLYNNGKRQWIFNSSHYIYLIDDNGKSVSGWPVWIPTGTQYPVSVFDINNDRNYQIFASGLFYKVSAFNTQGRLLPYWNPKDIWPNPKSSIGSFNYSGKQVFWTLNEKGKILFMNNQAKVIDYIKIDSSYAFFDVKIESLDTGTFVINGLDSNRFIQLTVSSTKPIRIVTFPSSQFKHFNIVSNGLNQKYFLMQAEKKIGLMDEKGAFVINKTTVSSSVNNVEWVQIGNGYKLVYADSSMGKLIIENTKGEPYKPFPMQVTTPFTIGNLFNEADNWLIFGESNNQLNLYRIK